jgi:hypothetical protein
MYIFFRFDCIFDVVIRIFSFVFDCVFDVKVRIFFLDFDYNYLSFSRKFLIFGALDEH